MKKTVLLAFDKPDLPDCYLAKGLHQSGFKTVVLVDPDSPHIELLNAHSELVLKHRFRRKIDIPSMKLYRTLCREWNFSIFHGFAGRALSNWLLAGCGKSIPTLAYRGTMGNVERYNPVSWISYLHPHVAKIVCVSKAVQNYFLGIGVSSSKLVQIYKGHDPNWYEGTERRSEIRREIGIPESRFLVGSVGNVRPNKGLDTLLEALSHCPDMDLLIAGEIRDPAIAPLIKSLALTERVTCLGFRNDAVSVASACDVTVVPSRVREGFPKAMLESMMLKIPVVVTRVGGMPEVVVDGVHGCVIEPGDSRGLARALAGLRDNPEQRRRFGENARERVIKDFPIEQTIRQTRELYDSLA